MKYIITGDGKECPKCGIKMQRRKHSGKPKTTYYFTAWDYCLPCRHVQHYEEFKSNNWNTDESNQSMFENSLFKD